MSFSFRLVIDQSLIGCGVANANPPSNYANAYAEIVNTFPINTHLFGLIPTRPPFDNLSLTEDCRVVRALGWPIRRRGSR
jgi:hypothetical protein